MDFARDINERLKPGFREPNASRMKLISLAAREWRRITAFEHSLRSSRTAGAAKRAASFAVDVIPHVESITPWRFFQWYGIATLARNEELKRALSDIDEKLFDRSGATPSLAAKMLAGVWSSGFVSDRARMDHRAFFDALELDRLDILNSQQLETLGQATFAALSQNPDDLESAVGKRADLLTNGFMSPEDRYLPEALLDLPLIAVIELGNRYRVRILSDSPYISYPR